MFQPTTPTGSQSTRRDGGEPPTGPEENGSIHTSDLATKYIAILPTIDPRTLEMTPSLSPARPFRRNKPKQFDNDYEWGSIVSSRRQQFVNSDLSRVDLRVTDKPLTMTSPTKSSPKWWTDDEHARLHELVGLYSAEGQWDRIAKEMPGRTASACYRRWLHLNRGVQQNRARISNYGQEAVAISHASMNAFELGFQCPRLGMKKTGRYIHITTPTGACGVTLPATADRKGNGVELDGPDFHSGNGWSV
ncbi:hypothetical protein B0O80DRAFT_425159 [Mortierella sp. GBAus27b]|nr:hypothetical protein B0O80DRAFT_425159 [Mortierella sp. GBAus27b]